SKKCDGSSCFESYYIYRKDIWWNDQFSDSSGDTLSCRNNHRDTIQPICNDSDDSGDFASLICFNIAWPYTWKLHDKSRGISDDYEFCRISIILSQRSFISD